MAPLEMTMTASENHAQISPLNILPRQPKCWMRTFGTVDGGGDVEKQLQVWG